MRIRITTEKTDMRLIFPTSLVFSRLGLVFLQKSGNKSFTGVNAKSMKEIRRTVKKMKKLHKDWYAVEACSADGSGVRIRF